MFLTGPVMVKISIAHFLGEYPRLIIINGVDGSMVRRVRAMDRLG
jgi:hypothetical protein